MKQEESIESMAESINAVARNLTAALQPVADAFGQAYHDLAAALRPAYDGIYAEYLAAGAPYGETHEGMMRWFAERGRHGRVTAISPLPPLSSWSP